jgi:2-polyprenyl-3-methyl-5-hydroxy-6-metoxy-1,4-benzoquinol methylase
MTATPVLDAHREQLRGVFLEWLLEMEPDGVLDLGAGSGELVAALWDRGVEAEGIEAADERVAEARALDRPVEPGSAERVDRPDDSAPWVVVRHVLHHLERPEQAVREALRVARDGVLIAEPMSRTALPMHAATARLEDALRALDRRRGMRHDADLAPSRIVAMLPRDAAVEVRLVAPMTPLPREEVQALIERSAGGVPIEPAQHEGLAMALDAAEAGWLAPAGSAMIAARLVGR